MTSASVGTYAGEYLCDGWVHNLELTLFINTTYSLFSDSGRQSEENKKLLKTQKRTEKANNLFAV